MLTPKRVALVFNEEKWTFKDLVHHSKQMAGKIAHYPLKKGDAVAVLLKNRPHTVWIIHALQQLGMQTVFLNHRLTTSELVFQIKDSKAKLLITEAEFAYVGKKIKREHDDLLTTTVKELENNAVCEVESRDVFSLDEVCSIMYTSGTTGHPKGVLQTYGNHWWSAIGSVLNMGLNEKDAWLCTVPLFHISGLSIIIRSIVYGIPVYLKEHFSEVEVNELLKTGKVTIMSVVSTMLQRMIRSLGSDTYANTFRCMLLGGGPAPIPLLETCKEKNIPVFQTYGMTETASQIVTLSPEDSLAKLGSAGKPLFPAQVKIIAEGKEVAAMEPGEITVKGPNVTIGYLNRPKANRESFVDGWFATGDIGYVDEEGYLYVLDRRSDLIISGGENIYPAEIEEVLLSHPAIIDAGVAGVEDQKWGQVPYGFVVAATDISSDEIISYCEQKLAAYKLPKKIIFCDSLPRNAANKLLRRKLVQFLK